MTELKPILIYDGNCGFCAICVDYWRHLTGDEVVYAPSREVAGRHPEISAEEFRRSVWLVFPGGRRSSGAEAAFRLAAMVPGKRWPLFLYERAPGFAPASEAAYRFIAAHRGFFYWVTRLFWGKRVVPASYDFSRSVFLRGLALVYFIAFLSLLPQVSGLIGSNGISPAGTYLAAIQEQFGTTGFWTFPTLAWFSSTDTFLRAMCWTGAGLAAALFIGFVPIASLAGLCLLYLSLVTAGQDFLAFQWDALLLETGFAAILLAPRGIWPSFSRQPSAIGIWVTRFLLFRLMLESGMVKLLSGDSAWRNLTALNFHYETQPLPTPVAWYAHQLPAGFQKACVAGVFAIELVTPFLFLMPRRPRIVGAWTTIVFQLLIAVTGNYTFFNLLTILLCVMLLDDRHLGRSTPSSQTREPGQRTLRIAAAVAGTLLIVTGLIQLLTMAGDFRRPPGPFAWLDEKAQIFHVVNRYGLFAVMTTSRSEIVIEGSDDGTNWKAYEFKFKPGDVTARPKWIAPFQPRLDWQMWFAALSTASQTPWFSSLMLRLLEGSPEVLPLLKTNPFPNGPPKMLRAVVYDYHFSDPRTRASTGAWWRREYLGTYFPAVSLKP